MPMTTTERAAIGGRARIASMTPEQRTAHGRAAYLAGAAKTIENRAAELPPETRVRLIRALQATTHESKE